MKAEIEWKRTADELPDDDETVLCGWSKFKELETGWLDSEHWRSMSGDWFNSAPDFWAHLPEVPSLATAETTEEAGC